MSNPFEEITSRLERIESILTTPAANNSRIIEKPLTTEELCEFLGITKPTIIRMKKRGTIPFIQIGGSIRYDKAAVIKALEKKNDAD